MLALVLVVLTAEPDLDSLRLLNESLLWYDAGEPVPPSPPRPLPDAGTPEPPSHALTPLQGDLSVSFGLTDRRLLAGALFIGATLGWANDGYPALFGAVGPELTYTAQPDPYRISLGAQLRFGLAWARHQGFDRTTIPDLLVYLRVTAFGAGVVTQMTTPMGMSTSVSRSFFGVRAGLGLTSLWPARQYVEHFPLFDVDGPLGEVLKVLTTLIILPFTLLNHAEVAFEYAMSPSPLTALLFRVGTGF